MLLRLYVDVCGPGAKGDFEQFGRCMACPPTTFASVGAMLGIAAALVVSGLLIFLIRKVLPVDVLKLGLSMLQVFPVVAK